MLELKNVKKSYDGTPVLTDISLNIEDGEIVSILGPSGCGKTTLLKMINKLLPMNQGDILIDGKSVRDIPNMKLRQEIGYVVQEGGLFPHLTVRENLEIVPQLEKMEPDKRQERIFELLDMVNLEPKLYSNSYPCQLSGGQRQRVGVARAFATDSDLILMDEPFSALDPLTREELQDEIVKLQKEYNKTIVFVTHDMDEAIKCADKICFIQNGNVIQFDRTEEILKHPANDYVEKFVGKNRIWGNPRYIHASDIMCKEPYILSKDRTVLQALQTMRQNAINSIIVVSGKNRCFEGMVWLEDLRDLGGQEMSRNLGEVLSSDYVTVCEDTSLQDIIDEIDYKKSGIIPVLNERRELRGSLSKSILLATLSRRYRTSEEAVE